MLLNICNPEERNSTEWIVSQGWRNAKADWTKGALDAVAQAHQYPISHHFIYLSFLKIDIIINNENYLNSCYLIFEIAQPFLQRMISFSICFQIYISTPILFVQMELIRFFTYIILIYDIKSIFCQINSLIWSEYKKEIPKKFYLLLLL
jgi:hypothetical protein